MSCNRDRSERARRWKGIAASALLLSTALGAQEQDATDHESIEEIIVTTTRRPTRLADTATRIEVVDQEELEEKVAMSPGDVVMLLSETSGLRVQMTAPGLGAANVRIQGLRGQYSQVLADGDRK